ncbi:MAG: ATP-binding cassette domain-containing protein [Gammaproteobacteria bacterium]|nr:ATP-binding cassette domain-containing protein [Gammaproteobacteria bacterium]
MKNQRIVIEAKGLVPDRSANQLWEPRPLDCVIDSHTITCLMGPYNCGKTTYLRALGAVDKPYDGELHLLGKDVWHAGEKVWWELRKKVGFITESAPLLSVMNGLRNVMLPALYHGMGNDEEVEAKARALIERLGSVEDLALLPGHASEPQNRVLALARALILEPEVLMIDEPAEPLDTPCRQVFLANLVDLVRKDGLTLVVVTHNIPFIRMHADNIIFSHPQGMRYYKSWSELENDSDQEIQAFLHPDVIQGTAGQGHRHEMVE